MRAETLSRRLADLQLPKSKTASISWHRQRRAQGGSSADAMLRWGSMRLQCQHSMPQLSWRGVGVFCYQRRWGFETERWWG
jgi:hypothetical protein